MRRGRHRGGFARRCGGPTGAAAAADPGRARRAGADGRPADARSDRRVRGVRRRRVRRDGRRSQSRRPVARPHGGHQGAGPPPGLQRRGPPAVRPRGEGGGRGPAPERHRDPQRLERRGAAVPRDAVRPRDDSAKADRRRGTARTARDAADWRAGGGRPRRRPRTGTGPPGHQAGQHPAGGRGRAGHADRLRARPGGGRRDAHVQRGDRRHAAVHVPRAGPRRGGRPGERFVQPRQRPVRGLHRPPAVPGRGDVRRDPADRRRRAHAGPPDQPGRPGLARVGRRPADGQTGRGPLRVGRGGRGTARAMPRPPAAARGRGPSGLARAPSPPSVAGARFAYERSDRHVRNARRRAARDGPLASLRYPQAHTEGGRDGTEGGRRRAERGHDRVDGSRGRAEVRRPPLVCREREHPGLLAERQADRLRARRPDDRCHARQRNADGGRHGCVDGQARQLAEAHHHRRGHAARPGPPGAAVRDRGARVLARRDRGGGRDQRRPGQAVRRADRRARTLARRRTGPRG